MATPKIFPVPNSTLPYWRSELHENDSVRSTEYLPAECDIVIVGAGISGVSTAYHLLDENPSPPSVVILEAREVCSGATGRNGGHLKMTWQYIDMVTEFAGPEAAKELALFQAEQVYAMKNIVEKERLDCDLVLTRSFEAMLDQSHADEMREVYDNHLKAGLDYIGDVDFIGPKFAERLSGVKGAKAAVSTTAAQLWPYKFVTGLLARLLERTSLNVQTHTCVSSISLAEDGSSVVNTARGSIRAQKVIYATNAYTAGILPEYTNKITPMKIACSHISVTKDTEFPPPHLSNTYGLNISASSRDYLIPRPDGGIICGGANWTYNEDKSVWFNNFDDSTPHEPARKHFETVMQDNFVGWQKSGAIVDYFWTGIKGTTADNHPHCGKVPGKENHFILAGFNGAGMSHIFLTAKGIAKMIRENVEFEDSGIPKTFKTTEDRLKKDVTP